MARLRPAGMPEKTWDTIKDRAEKAAESAGTAGQYNQRYNQAIGFYVDRWQGKAPNMPSWMPSPSKQYPRKITSKKKK